MKNIIRSMGLIAGLVLSNLSFAAPGAALQVISPPQTAPALVLNDTKGKKHDLSAYKGQVVMVNFWASWCPSCVKEMPSMQRLSDALHKKNIPFQVLAVNIGEEPALMNAFLKKVPVNFPVLLDENADLISKWQVYAYPSTFIIDKHGKARYALFGGIEWDSPDNIQLISELSQE